MEYHGLYVPCLGKSILNCCLSSLFYQIISHCYNYIITIVAIIITIAIIAIISILSSHYSHYYNPFDHIPTRISLHPRFQLNVTPFFFLLTTPFLWVEHESANILTHPIIVA